MREADTGVDEARSRFLVDLIGKYAENDSRILEVGCRDGRNLASLWRAGYRNLCGIESRPGKVAAFRKERSEVAAGVELMEGPVDRLLGGLEDSAFDVVFTVGFLFDRSGDHSWLYPQLAGVTSGHLVFIEDEGPGSYRPAFEALGMEEVESVDLKGLEDLQSTFTCRVFRKVSPSSGTRG